MILCDGRIVPSFGLYLTKEHCPFCWGWLYSFTSWGLCLSETMAICLGNQISFSVQLVALKVFAVA